MAWATVIMTVRLVWPSEVVGTTYAALFTAGIVSSAVFNLGMFGPMYDAESQRQHHEHHGCTGESCFAPTMYLLSAGNALTVLSAVAFHRVWMRHQRQTATTRAPSGVVSAQA